MPPSIPLEKKNTTNIFVALLYPNKEKHGENLNTY